MALQASSPSQPHHKQTHREIPQRPKPSTAPMALKRRLPPPDNPESPPSVKRIRGTPKPTSTTSSTSLLKILNSTPQSESSSAEACPSSYTSLCLLSVHEARAVLNNLKVVKRPFTIVNLPGLYNIIEMHSKRIQSTLPWDEHYALIDGELGRIKLVSEKRKLCEAKKWAKASRRRARGG